MYTRIDELFYKTLATSNDQLIQQCTISLPGLDMITAKSNTIIIAEVEDELATEGFQFDERLLTYQFALTTAITNYLQASRFLQALRNSIVTELRTNNLLENYQRTLTITNISPQYINENNKLYRLIITVTLKVNEEYFNESEDIEEIIETLDEE